MSNTNWIDREEYPFASHYFDVPAGRLHYVDEGSGSPIVMVHGNPTWSFLYRDLIKRLTEFPAIAAEATERRGPQAVPVYAIRVADDFHRFYTEHRVLGSDEQAFRLALCRGAQCVISRALDLVGVEAPERM